MKVKVLSALLISVILTAAMACGVLYSADNTASDALYQRTGSQNPDIIIIGIDQDTIDELGPVYGLRGEMADAIRILNADPEKSPAVIGIDLMFTGENKDAVSSDAELAQAAGAYNNVVVAADAKIGNTYVSSGDGTYYMRQQSVLGWYPPYSALARSTQYGHINEMLDKDGIFRHALLSLDIPEEGAIPSFARVIYQLWCEASGSPVLDPPAVTSNGFYYLPFSSTADDYSDGFNFLDLINGKIDPHFYAGKIVLIGPTAPGMQDSYLTSLDHSREMPGVAIQANIIEAFQKGFFPREVKQWIQLVILFVISLGMMLFFWNRKVIPSIIGWFVICLCWIGVCLLFYYQFALIMHVLWIPVCVTMLLMGSIAWNYVRSQKEKRLVTDTFGYYIDPAVRDQLLTEGRTALELGGKTQNIAVLFVDVRGFTALSEALDAQTVVEIVNQYLTLTTDCIMKHHGTLDKFVGDCTMAIWNAPVEQEDPVFLACKAAIDMVTNAKGLEETLKQKYGRAVSFGIGINWGPAVVGNIGAPKRMDYTAIGDTVNTAARLEEIAPGGTILISRAVADELGARAEYLSIGDQVSLKGKSEGFEVLKLLALKEE